MSRFVRVGLLCGVFAVVLPAAAPAQPGNPPRELSKVARAGEERLTMESLKEVLEGLAYEEVEELKNQDGKLLCYQVKRVEGIWTFYGRFEISPDQSQLWITMTAPRLEDPSAVPSRVLLEMLAVNDEVWPSYFAYSRQASKFALCLPVANRGLKAKDLRSRFETACAQFKANEHLWNPEKWPDGKAAESPKSK